MFDEQDRQYFYNEFKNNGYEVGSYDDFKKDLNNKEDRDWYYNEAKNMGYDVGTQADFDKMVLEPAPSTSGGGKQVDASATTQSVGQKASTETKPQVAQPAKKQETTGKEPGLIAKVLDMIPTGVQTSNGTYQPSPGISQPVVKGEEKPVKEEASPSSSANAAPVTTPTGVVNNEGLMDAKLANYIENWKLRPDKQSSYFENMVADLLADGTANSNEEAVNMVLPVLHRYANRSAMDVTNQVVSSLPDDTVQDAEQSIGAQWYSHGVQDKLYQKAYSMGMSYDDYVAHYLKPAMVQSLVNKYGPNYRNIADGIATRLYSHYENVQDRLMNQDINDALSSVINKYVNPSVVEEYNKAQEAGSKVFTEGMEGSQFIPANLRLGTALGAQYEANEAKDPAKVLSGLQQKFGKLYRNPKFLNDMSNAAFKVMQRYGLNGTQSSDPKQFKPMINAAIKNELDQLEIKGMMPKGSAEYIMKTGLGNTIVGKITRKIMQTDYQNWLEDIANQQYQPGFWENVASGALTFAGDAWSYWLPGAAGGKLTKSMVAKAEGKLAGDLMAKGMERRVAERAAKVLIGKSKAEALKSGAVHGAVTFGGQSAISKPIDEIYRTGQFDENGMIYNPSVGKVIANTLGEVTKQSAVGAIMQGGTIANMIGKGRGLATNILADVGGKVVDSGIMTGHQMLERMAQDPNFKPTGKDAAESFLESMANLTAIGLPGMVGKYARFKDAREFNKKYDFTDQDIAELKRFGYDGLRDAFEKVGIGEYAVVGENAQRLDGQLTQKYMDLMNDKSVPEVLKAKMMAVVEGKRPSSFSPIVDSIIVQPMDHDGKVYLETLNKDGGIIDRKEFSSLDEAQKADKKLEYEKTLGLASVLEGEFHKEFTQEHLDGLYNKAAQKYNMGEKLTDEDKAAVYLHQNAGAIKEIMDKQQKGVILTDEEQKQINAYRHYYDSALENSSVMREFVNTFEDSHGVARGTLRKALESKDKKYAPLVESYLKELYNSIELKREMKDTKELMNQTEETQETTGATQEGGASAQNASATAEKPVDASVSSDVPPTEPPTPPVGGETPSNADDTPSVENNVSPSDADTASNESKSDAYVMGQNAYRNGDAEGLKAIDHNDDVSKARLKRAFADDEAKMNVAVKAYEDGKDMEQFIAQRANSMTTAQQDAVRKYVEAQDAKKGVYDALQHADDGYAESLKQQLSPYTMENGNIFSLTLTDGQRGYWKSKNDYGAGFGVFPDANGKPVVKQVYLSQVKEEGKEIPLQEYVNELATQKHEATKKNFEAMFDATSLKPNDTVNLSINEKDQPTEAKIVSVNPDGTISFNIAGSKNITTVPVEKFNKFQHFAQRNGINAELDVEDAQRAENEAIKAEADKKQRYANGIVGLIEGQPDYSSKDTDPNVAAEYLQEQFGEDHGQLLNLVNGSRDDIKTQLASKRKAAAEYQNWLDTNADLDPEKAKKMEDELSLVNEQIADLDARFKNWNTIRNSVMTPDEVKAMKEERKAEIERAGIDKSSVLPDVDTGVRIPENSELKDKYPTQEAASSYITSERRRVYKMQEETQREIDGVDKILNQYMDGDMELSAEQLRDLNTTKAELTNRQNALTADAKALKGKAESLNILYIKERAEQNKKDLEALSLKDRRKELVTKALEKKDMKAIKEIYKDASTDVMDLTPRTLEEFVSERLFPHSLNAESLAQELGSFNFKRGIGSKYDTNKYNYLLAENGEGLTISELAKRVWEDLSSTMESGGGDGLQSMYTDQDIRNTILDMFKTYDSVREMRNVTLLNRIAAAENELSGEEEWYEQQKEREIFEKQKEIDEYKSYIHDKELSLPSESELDYINGLEFDRMMEIEDREREYKQYVKSILPKLADYDDRSNEEGYGGGSSLGSDSSRRGVDEGNSQGEEVGNGEASSKSEIGEGSDSGRKGRQETGSMEPGEGSAVRGSHLPQEASFGERLKSAIAETETEPTEAQKKAGNYKKGHLSFGGYDYTVETPKGVTRSGKDEQGKPWSVTMHDIYGYILGKIGVDGDHIDMFINDAADLDSFDGNVYVVDQVNPETGEFDEHKVMYGFPDEAAATKAYLSNYSQGWKGLGKVTSVPKATFDKWLESSDRKTKPFREYAMVQKEQAKFDRDVKEVKPSEMTEAQKVAYDAVSTMLKKAGIPVKVVSNEDMEKVAEAQDNLNLAMLLNQPEMRFKIKTPEEKQAAENAYNFAKELRPDKWKQYAVVDMSNPNMMPEYFEKQELARKERSYYNKLMWGNYKVFNLNKSFEDNVAGLTGSFPSEFAPYKIDGKGTEVQYLKGKGVVYGYTDGKEIVLNQEHLNPNTPIHEYQHLWRTAAKNMNPELIEHGDKLIMQTQLFADLKQDPNYNHLTDEQICDEAFARLTGEDGAAILEQMAKDAIKENPLDTAKELSVINKLKEWLKKFWYWTLDTFTKWKPEDIKKMTLEDIRNLVLRDLANGVDPRNVKSRMTKEDAVSLRKQMADNAEQERILEHTEENWLKEFGKDSRVTTPIGSIKLGENQYKKAGRNDRIKRFGLLKPTLERPDVILEKSAPKDGAERQTKYLFIKSFKKADGNKILNYESITVKQGEEEVAISAHQIDPSKVLKELTESKVLWNRFRGDSNSLGENQGSALTPSANNPSGKDSVLNPHSDANIRNNIETTKGNGGNLSVEDKIKADIDDFESIADEYGLDADSVRRYAEGMAEGNLALANQAFASIRIAKRRSMVRTKLSEFVKIFSPIEKELYDRFGNINELREEYVRRVEEERNMMEAARKKAEEELRKREARLEELAELTDEEIDNRYAEALEKGNEVAAREMLDEAARRKGYDDADSSYQGVGAWSAPSNPGYESDEARRNAVGEDSPDLNVEDMAAGYSNQPQDIFVHPNKYSQGLPTSKESGKSIQTAIDDIRNGKKDVKVKVYRAVPTSVKEGKLRNGDWVTPSKKYAELHGDNRLEGKYRIIEDEVPVNALWWDSNDVNEWGYDNGKDYRYKNVKNNRKLNDLVTRDDNGNVIPPSKRFNSRKSDVRFMFAGEKGAAEADKAEEKTYRMDNLKVAEKMERGKKDAKIIKMATGWEKGVDGKWRYEMPDAKIKDTIDVGGGNIVKRFEEDMLWTDGKLEDAVDAPKLFEAYPQLKNIKIHTDAVMNDMPSNGEYNPQTKTITIHADELKYLNSILNHEIQHAIQYIEGFGKGGSPEQMEKEFKAAQDEWKARAYAHELEEKAKEMGGEYNQSEVEKALVEEYKDLDMSDELPDKETRIKGFNYFARGYADRSMDDAIKRFRLNESTRSDFDSYKEYLKLAGEVESRNVQNRLGMTDDERRNSLAEETEDVNRDEQIVMNVGDTSYSIVKPRLGSATIGLKAAKDKVAELFHKAKSGEFNGKPQSIGTLTQEGKKFLEDLSGLKMKDKIDFVLNPSDLKHMNKDHFGDNEKDPGRNIPLTEEDLRSMVDVIMNPEQVVYGIEKMDNRKAFFFLKQAEDGTLNLAEIYSDKKGNLTAKSYYKTKKGVDQRVMEIKNSLLPTPEASSGSPLSDGKGINFFSIEQEKTEENERKIADSVVNTANKLGGAEATVYSSLDDVPEEYRSEVEQGAKGWYDPETHSVHVYLPNCEDGNDAQRTVFHEKIGHEGMEVLLGGEDGVRKFANFVYRSVGKDVRGKIIDFANKYDLDWKNPDRMNVGMQEYIAHLAEEGPKTAEDFSLWTKIKHYLIKVLKKLGIRVPGLLNDKDLRYYLMKAGKALHVWDNTPKEKQEAMMKQASNAEIKDALGDGADLPSEEDNKPKKKTERGRIDEATGAFKLAPNGEQSNLSKKQYIEARTKNFKDWFGGDWEKKPKDFKNKLDANGEPLEKYVEGYLNRPKKPTMPKKRKGEDEATFFERKMLYSQALEDWPKTEADWKKRIDDFDENTLAAITPPDEEAIREKYQKQYENDMASWRKDHPNIEEGEERPQKIPDMRDYQSIQDYGEALGKHEIWKTAPNKDEYERMAEDEIVSKVALMDAVQHPFSEYARLKAMKAEFQHMRHVMQNQKVYDQNTTDAVVQLAKRFMSLGYGDDLGRGSINTLLTIVKNSTGKKSHEISQHLYQVMDVLMNNQLRNFDRAVMKTMSIKELKENAKGIQVQGKLELRGQTTIKAFRDAVSSRISSDKLDEKISNLIDKMAADKKNASSYQDELLGLNLAKQYVDYIDSSRNDAIEIEDMKRMEIEGYKNRKGIYEGELTKALRQEHVERLNQYDEALFNNKVERMERYSQLLSNLGGMIDESVKGAREFQERDARRAIKVKMMASADLGDKSMNQHHKENWKTRLSNSDVVRFLGSPLGSFDALMREFGSKQINGEGQLWNHFVRGAMKASNDEFKSVREANNEIDLKVSELFGKVTEDKDGNKKGNMILNDLYALERSNKVKSLDVTIRDIEGEQTYKLQQGNLMYIYMVNKMPDGAMKLRQMGILDADVERIKENIDPRFLKLADWIQGEFLPKMRTKYNKRHEELFGAPMPMVENYFPLRVLKNARYMEEDVNNTSDGSNAMPSTATGAIIKRKINKLPLDILNADALSVTIDNIHEMENWYNYAPIRKDANTLLSDTAFRNRVQNMTTIYGSGERLWNNVKDATAVAMGTYRPKGGTDLAISLKNFGKGITGAKISGRLYTAFKQILSAPLFLPDADLGRFVRYSIKPYSSFKWAIENMPNFDKRWSGRKLGDTVLMDDPTDWKIWHTNLMEKAAYYGMTPNALVDAVTCAVGARAVYDTKYKQYIKAGLTEERAKEKALSDAEINFNTSQQSSEGAFVSPMQLDRTLESAIFTPFRNSSMLYERKGINALRNLKHRFEKGHKEASIKFMAGQLMEEGVGYEQATKAAEKMYQKGLMHNIVDAIVPLWLGPIIWNLGGSLGYLLFGDDNEKKKKMVLDAVILGLLEGPVDGLAGGQFINTAIANTITSDGISLKGLKNVDFSGMPMLSDFSSMIEKFGYDKVAGVQDLMFMVMQSSTGFNPKTLTDAINACIDYGHGDMTNAKEIALFVFRLMNGPAATVDNLYIDELGMKGKDAKKLSYEELAKRYAEYKFGKNTFGFGKLYSDEEKQKKLKAIEKSFDKKVSERLAGMDREDLKNEFSESRSQKEKKLIGKIIADELATKDSEAVKKAKADASYLRQRNFSDLMDDLYLQKEWEATNEANAGLEELKDNGASEKEIEAYKTKHKADLDKRNAIKKARKEMQKKKADISSDNDDATMAEIRKLRDSILKMVRQTKK